MSYVPAEPNSFVGRQRELTELSRLMQASQVVTLCGPGGVGKTRLAVRLLALEAAAFPDEAWFVDLADVRRPDLVAGRVAQALGIDEEPGCPLAETLAGALRLRRLLLALDTCEHVTGACADLVRQVLAGAPGVRLLVTSREPLRVPGETVWEVPPLSVAAQAGGEGGAAADDAVRLFRERAAACSPGFAAGLDSTGVIVEICRAVDGLPLAIELAAALTRVLTVEQICARLGDRFGLLTGGNRTAPPRQRTLRAAIEWSHELLTAPERVLFRRLSVLAGWSPEMAAAVCCDDGTPAADVPGLVAALAGKSLIVAEPEVLGQVRYRMLDTIREYAAAELAGAGEAGAYRLRLRDYVLGVAEDSLATGMAGDWVPWTDRVDCSRRYDAEAQNVSEVLAWCLDDGDVEAGLRICVAVSPRWIVWGAFAEGGAWLDSFLARDTAVSGRVRGPALIARAQLALSSDPAAAAAWAGAGLEMCRAAGEQRWTAAALNVLSEVALHAGKTAAAAASADAALAIAHDAGDGWNEGYALGTRAVIAARAGKLAEARQLAGASAAVMRRIDQRWGTARALLGLGDLARVQGDAGEALSQYTEALAILREIGARPQIARCLAGLGRVAMELGETEQARRHLARSIQLSQATGARLGIARGLEAFAALAIPEHQPERAVQLIAAATVLRQAAGLPPLPDERTQACLALARQLGHSAVDRLWAQGMTMNSDEAVTLALREPQPPGCRQILTLASVDRPPGAPPQPPPGQQSPPAQQSPPGQQPPPEQ